jgi:hypothetical protein
LIADAPQLYVPDKITVIADHELGALEEIFPPEVTQLDKITSEVTAPRQITDVNALLHVNGASSGENNDHSGTSNPY